MTSLSIVDSKSSGKKSTPIIDYTRELSTTSYTAIQKELLDATMQKAERCRMIGAPEVHEMGKAMIVTTNAKKVLDVGTFTGASALSWALALPADGRVVSMDINHTDLDRIGRPILEKAPELLNKIDFRLGSAIHTLDSLIEAGESGTFGFAFIDADKESYPVYYEKCVQLLAPGGIIMVDNALAGGTVLDAQNARGAVIDKMNKIVAKDDRVLNTLLDAADGIHLIAKKRNNN